MAVTYELMKTVTARLFERSLRKVPEDVKGALRCACGKDTSACAQKTLGLMLESAESAERNGKFLCSDAGFPSYHIKIGTQVRFEGDVRQAIIDGFDELSRTIEPPIMQFVNNPLTDQRSYSGKDVPPVTFDLVGNVDYVDVTCAPKALATGRWAAVGTFISPTLDTIEDFVMECVVKAAPQICPPGVVGVGIGGSFDQAAKMATMATLRPLAEVNPEPILADMEARLLEAVNQTGFGPMGTGGDTTALAVHVDYASGHGYTPVAVTFSCWINRRSRARIYNSGSVEYYE